MQHDADGVRLLRTEFCHDVALHRLQITPIRFVVPFSAYIESVLRRGQHNTAQDTAAQHSPAQHR